MAELNLDIDAVMRLKQFQDDGLVWLVNTALLHPRGYALCVHKDTDGNPVGLSILGDGSEPWCFAPEDAADSAAAFNFAEERREADWTAKLKPQS